MEEPREVSDEITCLLCPIPATGTMKTDEAGYEHVRVCRVHLHALETIAGLRCALKALYADDPAEAESMLAYLLVRVDLAPSSAEAVPWRHARGFRRLYLRLRSFLTKEHR